MHLPQPLLPFLALLPGLATAGAVPAGEIDCKPDAVDPVDLRHAQDQLHAFCDAGETIRAGVHVTFVNGSTVAYMCNYADYWAPCSVAEVDDAFSQIGAQCGFPKQGGDYWISQWGKTYGYGKAGDESPCDNGASDSDSEGEDSEDEAVDGEEDTGAEIEEWGMSVDEEGDE